MGVLPNHPRRSNPPILFQSENQSVAGAPKPLTAHFYLVKTAHFYFGLTVSPFFLDIPCSVVHPIACVYALA
jgi:hypothetical protein